MLNTEKWKTFVYDKVFIIRKGFYNKKPDSSEGADIPFLGATDSNNGITSYHTIDDITSASKTGDDNNSPISEKIFPANAVCVTNNGSVGYAYYQPKEFTCSHDVNPLYRKDGIPFNHKTGLFIATVIMKDRYRWQYGRKWRPVRMVKSTINLPILTDNYGQCIIDPKKTFSDEGYIPDWKYMEEFIERLETRERESQGSIRDALRTKNRADKILDLNINDWKEFLLQDIFEEIYKSEAYVKSDLTTFDSNKIDRISFISRTEKNNGCDCYVPLGDISVKEKGNAIIIGDTTSTIYYQENDFITGDHIVVCRAKWINKYTALFIKSLIEKERYKYSYGRAFKMDLIKKTKINLPAINANGEFVPDWNFMENYINSLPYGDKI